MLWSQRSLVLVTVYSAVFFSAFIAARSSYKGKLKKHRRQVFDRVFLDILPCISLILICIFRMR